MIDNGLLKYFKEHADSKGRLKINEIQELERASSNK